MLIGVSGLHCYYHIISIFPVCIRVCCVCVCCVCVCCVCVYCVCVLCVCVCVCVCDVTTSFFVLELRILLMPILYKIHGRFGVLVL